MKESELRHLMGSDDGLPADRHDRLKERVMATIRAEEPVAQQRPIAVPRFRRRLVPALVSVVVLATAGTAAAIAFGVFPEQPRSMLEEAGCRNDSSVEQLVATAETAEGKTHQFWITRADADALPNRQILVEVDAEGTYLGSSLGCGPPSPELTDSGNGLWAGAASETSEDGTLGIVMGHVPPPATAAVVTFSDGTSTRVDAQTDGYFLGLVVRPDLTGDAGFPDPIHMTTIDAQGKVVAEEALR